MPLNLAKKNPRSILFPKLFSSNVSAPQLRNTAVFYLSPIIYEYWFDIEEGG